MSNIILPDDLTEWPLLDKELHYVIPARMLGQNNIISLLMKLDRDTRFKFNMGHRVQHSCCYPRFDLTGFLYNIKPNPIYDILPDANPKLRDFTEIADARAIELETKAAIYETVYLFWSGGIDSTMVLCAILKNCSAVFCSKLVIVLNNNSIDEFPEMYHRHIRGKFTEANTDDFIAGVILHTNAALYLTGDCGDTIFGSGSFPTLDKMYPNVYKKSWVKNKDFLVSFFTQTTGNIAAGEFLVGYVEESMVRAKIEVDTIYDFLWWIDFNWGYNVDVYMTWRMGLVPAGLDARKYMEENLFIFFNSKPFQNWSVASIGTNLRIGDTGSTHKKSAKQYIFDYTKDSEYFLNKLKEDSAPKNKQILDARLLVAVDTDYNFYYGPLGSEWLPK